MKHYFSKDSTTVKSNPKVIAFRVHNNEYTFHTDHGVFSKNQLDRGTEVLLQYLNLKDTTKRVLDLGCGYGVIGIVLSKEYDVIVDMVEINERAIQLAKKNITVNNVNATVIPSDGFENVSSQYDEIVCNPPIRAGKKVIYRLFKKAYDYLNNHGEFTIVINKKHGAKSAMKELKTIFDKVSILGRKKGFYVINSRKHLTI